MTTGQNWTEILPSALAHNFEVLRRQAGEDTGVLAVLKADAYGHGAARCATVVTSAGARWLGVTHAAEGARVRAALSAAGVAQPEILAMSGPLPGDAALCREHSITPVIWTAGQAKLFANTGVGVHVEVDTGMSRQGARPGEELRTVVAAVRALGLRIDGIFTHFLDAEVCGSEHTVVQQRRFAEAVAQFREDGVKPRWVHAGNSSAIDNSVAPAGWLGGLAASVGAEPMVRSGLALYGYCLPLEPAAAHSTLRVPILRTELKPVLRWYAPVLAVRELVPGDTVGYNATWTATKPRRVALLGVGYADGLRRELSSSAVAKPNGHLGGWVLFAEPGADAAYRRRAPILGRISMNLTTVDVTHLPAVGPGAVAMLLGPGISADDHARLAGTIPYEILCGIHPCT